jgi:hypothetical protein
MTYNGTPVSSKAPNLPIGPTEYDQRYMDQLTNALRLYFAQLDNATANIYNVPAFTTFQAQTSSPIYVEGRIWYDNTQHALSYYNDSQAAVVHIGQDIQVKVINNTGSTIPNGSPVYITSTSSGQTYPNVALAKADVAATSAVIGLTNGAIANGSIGYVTAAGGIDNVNTGMFTVGQVLYLSPYSAGQLMNTVPPTGIAVIVGTVTYVDSSKGKIYVKQTTPLAVSASIITGTLGVDHGGTGMAAGYTVATLPTAGTKGRRSWVNDALAPTFGSAPTGGGTVVIPVFDNGTIWIVG